MIDIAALKSELATSQYSALSNSEALAILPHTAYVLRDGRVTFTTLGSVWGLTRAVAFRAALKAMSASANVSAAAMADYALGVLSGDGFDPGHTEVATAGAMLINAGICTAVEVRASQYETVYPFGGVPTTSDIATARAGLVADVGYQSRIERNAAKWNAYVIALDAWRAAGAIDGQAPVDL